MAQPRKVGKAGKGVSYGKWGIIFILPFFVIYTLFNLIPLLSTFYWSFFEYYKKLGKMTEPVFVGLDNFKEIFGSDMAQYAVNTFTMWIWGFIPQIIVSLLLAAWFTDIRLRLKGSGFFKTVIYMPNLIMASAFAMLFFALFADRGPVNQIMMDTFGRAEPYKFLDNTASARGLVALMNFLMWFGNTTILLMAGMMGIDTALFEAAEVDGATSSQVFFKITLPLLKPILVYVMITSLVGGIQMFDVPQVLTRGGESPDRTAMTVVMWLNKHLANRNYGRAGAVSTVLFIITAILSVLVYKSLSAQSLDMDKSYKKKKKRRR